jgi:hypothetical protein
MKKNKEECSDCIAECSLYRIKCSYGRAGYSNYTPGTKKKLYISLNIEANLRDGQFNDTIIHEAAHIATYQMKRSWEHSELWKKLYETGKKVR